MNDNKQTDSKENAPSADPETDINTLKSVTLDSMKSAFLIRCPECGDVHQYKQLRWIQFRSSDETWKHLCGRGGYIGACPACEKNLFFVCTILN